MQWFDDRILEALCPNMTVRVQLSDKQDSSCSVKLHVMQVQAMLLLHHVKMIKQGPRSKKILLCLAHSQHEHAAYAEWPFSTKGAEFNSKQRTVTFCRCHKGLLSA